MKKCAYCGKGNADNAIHCTDCGTTEFAPSAKLPPTPPPNEKAARDPKWLSVGIVALIAAIYCLTLGNLMGNKLPNPVVHFNFPIARFELLITGSVLAVFGIAWTVYFVRKGSKHK